jgi:gamma-glutamyltranspeptidase/glutathione hydrolase
MNQSVRGTRGIAVAPHALASQSALAVLREGGNAIEATIAAAATIAVVYPHMNSIGGDSFWLMHVPGKAPGAIDACGAAAQAAALPWFHERGIEKAIPFRGAVAASTVAGTVAGWGAAFKLARLQGGRLPLSRLLEDAIGYAEHGTPVTRSQALATAAKKAELEALPGFAHAFLAEAAVPLPGALFKQRRLAATLRRIGRAGTDDFYRGELARSLAADLARAGSPLAIADLRAHQAGLRNPLMLRHSAGLVFNMPPPSQGLASLVILGILDALRSGKAAEGSPEQVHRVVEATKLAFAIRDAYLTDPRWMKRNAQSWLRPRQLRELAERLDPRRAAPWPFAAPPADTVWLGVIDGAGRAVSFIQSLYHEFGSGLVLEDSGVTWNNRGCSFSLQPSHINAIAPGKKPLHTLSPGLAQLKDGRTLVYGAMGGDGQPQTQAALFSRIVTYGWGAQDAVSAPRWLLGRSWGQESSSLKLEARFPLSLAEKLGSMGHRIEIASAWDESLGHAGALLRNAQGVLEGGADPRSDGAAAAF